MEESDKTFAECINQAFRYIAIRDHNRRELFAKLRKKGYDSDTVNRVIDNLESDGSVNEKRYADVFIRSNNRRHPEGREIMLMRLLSKGADRRVSESVINEIYTEQYMLDLRNELTEKLQRRGKTQDFIAMQIRKVGL